MSYEKEELIKLDFLNPDFSTIKGMEPLHFLVPPELNFFLSHKVIDWLNKVNQSTNGAFNYNTVSLAETALRGDNYFSINIKTPAGAGTIYIEYDRYSQFKEASVVFRERVYINQARYPQCYYFFSLTIKINKNMELESYRLTRNVETPETHFLDIHYDFNEDGVKTRDSLVIVCDNTTYIARKKNVDNTYEFDNFFNAIVDKIAVSPNSFLEAIPQFKVRKINSDETLTVFYDELRKLYEKGLLNDLDDIFKVVKMAAI